MALLCLRLLPVCSLSLLVAFLTVTSLATAHGQTSVFQTGLVTEKSSYKLGESVYAKLILYNPSSERVAVHFSNGCPYDFVIRDMLGTLIHNETWHDCDPDILTGSENTSNVMTVDPGGGRWFSMSWDQLDLSGKHVPVPGDYLLSWSFRGPDQPIPEASKIVTLTNQTQTQLESIITGPLNILKTLGSVVWGISLLGGAIWSRGIKGLKRSSRLILVLPPAISAAVTGVIVLGFLSSRLVCMAIQCTTTFSLIQSLNIYLLFTPLVWAVSLVVGKILSGKKVLIPYEVFASWTYSSLILAFVILNSTSLIWTNTLYYSWTIVLPSYTIIIAFIPAEWLFTRTLLAKVLTFPPFVPVVKQFSWNPS